MWASYYRADWHGSGEIPARAVRSGLIGRFDAIDANEGGSTQRANLDLDWRWRPDLPDNQLVALHAYGTYYTLDLFNDFTFFLNDEQNGDMINQRDRRYMAEPGRALPVPEQAVRRQPHQYGRLPVPDRHRASSSPLRFSATSWRTQDVSIVEQSYSPFVKLDIVPLPWLRFVTGARAATSSATTCTRG